MKSISKIIKMMKGYNIVLILALLVSFLTVIIDLAGPYLLSEVVDALEKGREAKVLIVLYGISLVLAKLIDSGRGLLVDWYNAKTIERMRSTATQWLLRLRKYGKLPFDEGGIVTRLTADVDAVTQLLASPLNGLIPEILKGIGSLIILAGIRWEIAVMSVCFMPVFYYVTKRVNGVSKINARNIRGTKTSITSYYMDFVKNYRLYICYNGREQEKLRSENLGRELTQQNIKQSLNVGIYFLGIAVLRGLAIFISLLIVYKSIIAGTVGVGVIIIIINYIQNVFNPVIQLSRYSNQVAQANVAIQRVFDIEPENDECVGEFDELKENKVYDLSVQNLAISYSDDRKPAVNNFSFDMQGPGLLCLYGTSGSGKSTILNTLCGTLPVKEGSILVNGEDYTEKMLELVVQKRVRMVFQESLLFNRSIVENITYGMENTKEQADFVMNMGKKLKLDSLLDNMERSASAGVNGDSISGGERKRVALMRGVNQYADIYLFDEPTSELDDESRQCVANMIKELKQNSIVIVSTHDNALKEISDQVIYISST